MTTNLKFQVLVPSLYRKKHRRGREKNKKNHHQNKKMKTKSFNSNYSLLDIRSFFLARHPIIFLIFPELNSPHPPYTRVDVKNLYVTFHQDFSLNPADRSGLTTKIVNN